MRQIEFTARFTEEQYLLIEKVQKYMKKENKLILSKAEVLRYALEENAGQILG